jgi:hypothetical protein
MGFAALNPSYECWTPAASQGHIPKLRENCMADAVILPVEFCALR